MDIWNIRVAHLLFGYRYTVMHTKYIHLAPPQSALVGREQLQTANQPNIMCDVYQISLNATTD